MKLGRLGQGRHGKRAAAEDSDDDESDEDETDDEEEGMQEGEEAMGEGSEPRPPKEPKPGAEPPATFHYRFVAMNCGVNRIRSMPQQPAVVAVWGDNAQVGASWGEGVRGKGRGGGGGAGGGG